MDDAANTCTACFPSGSKPSCRVFDHSSGAVTIYSGLHATGESPTMCQQSDNLYRVCYIKNMVSTVTMMDTPRRSLLRA